MIVIIISFHNNRLVTPSPPYRFFYNNIIINMKKNFNKSFLKSQYKIQLLKNSKLFFSFTFRIQNPTVKNFAIIKINSLISKLHNNIFNQCLFLLRNFYYFIFLTILDFKPTLYENNKSRPIIGILFSIVFIPAQKFIIVQCHISHRNQIRKKKEKKKYIYSTVIYISQK